MRVFTLSTLFLLLFSAGAQAQLTKGTRYASGLSNGYNFANGQAELSWVSDEGGDFINLGISPELGYFFTNRLLLGANVTLVTGSGIDDDVNLIGAIGPFARYYFNPGSANNHFFVNAQLVALFDGDDDGVAQGNFGVGMTHLLAPGIGWDTYLALTDAELGSEGGNFIGLFSTLNVYFNQEQRAARKSIVSGVGRGSFMIGGSSGSLLFSVDDLRPSSGNSYVVNFAPNVVYFITDRLGLGASFGLGFSGSGDFFKSSSVSIQPQARYYFAQQQRRQWFAGAAFSTSAFRIEFAGSDVIKDNTSSISIGAGVNSFLTPNIALELSPNFSYNLDVNTARLGVDLGVQFFLNRKEN